MDVATSMEEHSREEARGGRGGEGGEEARYRVGEDVVDEGGAGEHGEDYVLSSDHSQLGILLRP